MSRSRGVVRPVRPLVPLSSAVLVVLGWGVVAHNSGAGWVQALGDVVAGTLLLGLLGPALVLARTRLRVTAVPNDGAAGQPSDIGVRGLVPGPPRPGPPGRTPRLRRSGPRSRPGRRRAAHLGSPTTGCGVVRHRRRGQRRAFRPHVVDAPGPVDPSLGTAHRTQAGNGDLPAAPGGRPVGRQRPPVAPRHRRAPGGAALPTGRQPAMGPLAGHRPQR